jgi:long-chain acyl-CoA synthetase
MTETSPLSFLSKGFESDGTHTWMEILPHTAAKIVDAQGITVPIRNPGELCVSGYLLQRGYYQNQEKTDEVMRVHEDGVLWMHTGDEAIMDEQGRCRISGRIKDTIIRGGENIYPAEIEDRLNEHPAISMSAVVGIQDAKYGEVVAAFLQLKHGENPCANEDISEWVQQILGKHKVPTLVFHLGVDGVPSDFPKTASGKIKKVDLVAIGTQLVRRAGKL